MITTTTTAAVPVLVADASAIACISTLRFLAAHWPAVRRCLVDLGIAAAPCRNAAMAAADNLTDAYRKICDLAPSPQPDLALENLTC